MCSCLCCQNRSAPCCLLLGCVFQRLAIHTAVTEHILELFPLPVLTNTPICLDTDHNTQALRPHNSVASCACPPMLHIQSVFYAPHSPSLAVAYILWLFLGNCDSQHLLSLLCYLLSLYPSSGSHVLVLGCHTILLAHAKVAIT